MEKLKLTVEQIRNYLGTNAKILRQFQGNNLFSELTNNNMMNIIDDDFSGKLIAYRLSDLDKEIEVNGERFVPIEKLGITKSIDLNTGNHKDWTEIYKWPKLNDWWIVECLFKWHFWPFGDEYFEQGLVIDKMTIKI